MVDLAKALNATLTHAEKRQRFVDAVLKHGHYQSTADILNDLEK